MATARRWADREIRGEASPGELEWLHAHPVLWYRALHGMWLETNAHSLKLRADLEAMKGEREQYGMASPEYMRAKREYAKKQQGREHFKQKVARRKAEVVAMMGGGAIDKRITGDLVAALADIVWCIDDGDLESARRIATLWTGRLMDGSEEAGA